MTTIYWDVDTQIDFIHADGKLAVPNGEAILGALKRVTEHAHTHGIRIVATADDHDVGHAEISDAPDWQTTFPPHCMRGTIGQLKVFETELRNPLVIHAVRQPADELHRAVSTYDGDILLLKPGTDVFRWNPNAIGVLEALHPDRIVVYGVATDICVKAAIEGLRRLRPEAELLVVTDAVAALDPAAGEALLAAWGAAGCTLVTTDDLTQ
ncbi:MAG TPA: isochorismatase family protein [Gemmatimonadales bacterium]|nr:isochorismatase family protein [Gemmatimonadales bacterium]